MKRLSKFLLMTLSVIVLASCNLSQDVELENFKLSSGLSIFATDEGKVGVSILVNENYRPGTEFWLDGSFVKQEEFKASMPAKSHFRTTANLNDYLATYVFKKDDDEYVEYKFFRNYILDVNNSFFYYKNGEKNKLDTVAYGVFHSAYHTEKEIIAGFFGNHIADPYYGSMLQPTKPYYIDAEGKWHFPKMPEQYNYFNGISGVHVNGDDVYISGLMNYPMYWKNDTPVRLEASTYYGEVSQMFVHDEDVYAVGFIDKPSANVTGHTACYWKNGKLVELQDGAVAQSVFVDKEGNLYIGGATGVYDKEYKACYWKNGERVDFYKEQVSE